MNPPDTSLPTSAPSLSTSPPAASDDGANNDWIAGAVVGPVASLGLCAVAYWLWTRYRSHHDRRMGAEREAHTSIQDEKQVGLQREVLREQVASPFMLHAESGRKTPELPC